MASVSRASKKAASPKPVKQGFSLAHWVLLFVGVTLLMTYLRTTLSSPLDPTDPAPIVKTLNINPDPTPLTTIQWKWWYNGIVILVLILVTASALWYIRNGKTVQTTRKAWHKTKIIGAFAHAYMTTQLEQRKERINQQRLLQAASPTRDMVTEDAETNDPVVSPSVINPTTVPSQAVPVARVLPSTKHIVDIMPMSDHVAALVRTRLQMQKPASECDTLMDVLTIQQALGTMPKEIMTSTEGDIVMVTTSFEHKTACHAILDPWHPQVAVMNRIKDRPLEQQTIVFAFSLIVPVLDEPVMQSEAHPSAMPALPAPVVAPTIKRPPNMGTIITQPATRETSKDIWISEKFRLALRHLSGQRFYVYGKSGVGKSNLVANIIEGLVHLGRKPIIIDMKKEWATVRAMSKADMPIFGGEWGDAPIQVREDWVRRLATEIFTRDCGCVLDTHGLNREDLLTVCYWFLDQLRHEVLAVLARDMKQIRYVIIDEAQMLFPNPSMPLEASTKQLIEYASWVGNTGRTSGLSFLFASQKVTNMLPSMRSQASRYCLLRVDDLRDRERYKELFFNFITDRAIADHKFQSLGTWKKGEGVFFSDEEPQYIPFQADLRTTPNLAYTPSEDTPPPQFDPLPLSEDMTIFVRDMRRYQGKSKTSRQVERKTAIQDRILTTYNLELPIQWASVLENSDIAAIFLYEARQASNFGDLCKAMFTNWSACYEEARRWVEDHRFEHDTSQNERIELADDEND